MTADLLNIEIEEYWDEDFREIFIKINQANSVEEMLKSFKNLTIQIKEHGFNECCLEKLLKIYFNASIKHPVKNLVHAFFNQTLNNNRNAQKVLDLELKNLITYYKNATLNDCYHLIGCLNEMSQNFKMADKSVAFHAKQLLELLTSIVESYLKLLEAESSPSRRNDIFHRLHNCLQAVVYIVKSHLNEFSTINELDSQIVEYCWKLLDNNEVSLETKNICGMLIFIKSNTNAEALISVIQNEDEASMKRLCLMYGFLTVEKETEILTVEKLSQTLESIYNYNTIDNAIIYAVSRMQTIITKKIFTMKVQAYSTHLESITKSTLTIAFFNIEHSVEAIRHLAKDSLKNLVDIAMKLNDTNNKILNEIFAAIRSISSSSTQAVVINAIHSSLPIHELLTRLPSLQTTLLSEITEHKEHKMNCYENLSKKCFKECSLDDWFKSFIEPIIKCINYTKNSEDDCSLLKALLLKCIKKTAIKTILQKAQSFDIGFYLHCLSLAKIEGELEAIPSNDITWKGVISFDEIKKFMVNVDDDIRISALQLIVETKKSTESFSEKEIDCILYFFNTNINVQSPSSRQNILGLIKKIFIRLQSVLLSMTRRNGQNIELQNHLKMLQKLHVYCIENIVDGANFSRRSLSLTILLNVLISMRDYFPMEIECLWNKSEYETLFNVFYDTFETNKEVLLKIMEFLPRSTIVSRSRINFEHIKKLMSSIRPADSLTASYLLRFSLKFSLLEFSTDTEASDRCSDAYKLLIWCENLLLESLVIGEKSIIIAAGSSPMYGILLCIRYIISKLDLGVLRTCSLWKKFFGRIVSICKRLSLIVSPIVNDSSPEGCIPKVEENMCIESNSELEKIIGNTTPQMVLLCAWRSVKEVSLLLGDLSLRHAGILSTHQLIEIGNHFIELLTNIKHRGAFEQSFLGFSQYCDALRMSELHDLPEKLLQNIMDSISGEKNHKSENDFTQIKNLCSTRRSAGLPYIIQALLMSEIKISQAQNFHYIMRNLIKFTQCAPQMETRIHSMNILRALFRCKDFNNVISEYISPSLQSALLGYAAHNSWAERNSSTLLFSALMIRIFGVQRNKDSEDINIKNKMSARVFFLRHPELYDFFMEQLIDAVDYVRNQKMNPKLHPMILLLNRLYTPISDNAESNMKLIDFIPIVTMCSSCVEFQTRVLCTKFIANSILPSKMSSRITENVNILKSNPNLIGNAKHARILEIFYLIKNSSLDDNQAEETMNGILYLIPKFKNEVVCLEKLLDIILEIFKNHAITNKTVYNNLQECFNYDEKAFFGIPLLYSKLITLDLVRGEINSVISINASMNSSELLEKLNCMLLILSQNEKDSQDLMDNYEINSTLYYFVKKLSSEIRQKMRLKISQNCRLIEELKKITSSSDANLATRSYEILTKICIKFDENYFCKLINEIETMPELIQKSLLKYVSMCINQETALIRKPNWNFLISLLDSSSAVKLTMIDILRVFIINASDAQDEQTLFTFIKCTFTLLVDDDFEVRQKSSNMVSELLRLDEVFMGPYAQELFLRHFVKSQSATDKEKVIALIIILLYDEGKEEKERSCDTCEFQVFEKNESSTFKEPFAIRKLCISILQNGNTQIFKNDDELKRLSVICSSMKNGEPCEEFEKFLKSIFFKI